MARLRLPAAELPRPPPPPLVPAPSFAAKPMLDGAFSAGLVITGVLRGLEAALHVRRCGEQKGNRRVRRRVQGQEGSNGCSARSPAECSSISCLFRAQLDFKLPTSSPGTWIGPFWMLQRPARSGSWGMRDVSCVNTRSERAARGARAPRRLASKLQQSCWFYGLFNSLCGLLI